MFFPRAPGCAFEADSFANNVKSEICIGRAICLLQLCLPTRKAERIKQCTFLLLMGILRLIFLHVLFEASKTLGGRWKSQEWLFSVQRTSKTVVTTDHRQLCIPWGTGSVRLRTHFKTECSVLDSLLRSRFLFDCSRYVGGGRGEAMQNLDEL